MSRIVNTVTVKQLVESMCGEKCIVKKKKAEILECCSDSFFNLHISCLMGNAVESPESHSLGLNTGWDCTRMDESGSVGKCKREVGFYSRH